MQLPARIPHSTMTVLFAITGILLGYLDGGICSGAAENITTIFIRLLKMLSMPLVFFSVVASLSKLNLSKNLLGLGKNLIVYTLGTTLGAAGVAALFYQMILAPHHTMEGLSDLNQTPALKSYNISKFIIEAIPDSFIRPFLQPNILAVLFIAIFIVISLASMPRKSQQKIIDIFGLFYDLILTMTSKVMPIIPVVVGAFTYSFVRDIVVGSGDWSPFLYFSAAILAANLFQGLVVLPILVKLHGISPLKLFYAMYPALIFGFFSKSSSASLPVVLDSAQNRAKLNPQLCRFTLPLCSTINMNACAGFIIISVLHVLAINGQPADGLNILMWIVISSIAALGNAAVPMGCYFLACSFLAAQDIPLDFMGAILPIYGLLDMIETAINIWSDSSITACLDKRFSSSLQESTNS